MGNEAANFRFFYTLARCTIGVAYRIKVTGRENIPEGAAIVCANHSCWADPFLMAFALRKKQHLCLMAKTELFKNKLVGAVLNCIGTFPVKRGEADLGAIRNTFRLLKEGKKVGIFPEGHRITEEDGGTPKTGAVMMADKAKVPILPMYIPRKKSIFKSVKVAIGEPIYDLSPTMEGTKKNYEPAANALMDTIKALGAEKA